MNEKLFMQLIEQLKDVAFTQGGVLTFAQLNQTMEELQLPDNKLEAIRAYLTNERIQLVEQYEERKESTAKKVKKMTPVRESSRLNIQETEIYRTYMEDISQITPCSEEEAANLCIRVKAGDDLSKNRLIEGSLQRVADYAKKYAGKGVAITDLIQEANMALMLYVQEAKPETYFSMLENVVATALELLLEETVDSNSIKEKIASRANRLMEVSAQLAEELEREPSLEELAQRMHISEDELRVVMKHSLSAMNVEENSLG